MKCVVPGANVKILARAVHALAKIGDEMYVEPQKNMISFRTVNTSNSAYADFTLHENYFSYYVYGDLQQDDALKCKISMRSAMAVFRTPTALDKQVETCHIGLEPDASEIIFVMKYKNSITKTQLLPILDCEVLQTAYNKNVSNLIFTQPRVLVDAVQNFQQSLIEVTLEVSPQKFLLRNYVDETSAISNTTRTQFALSIGEFEKFVIGNETAITFCMKEFRAILNFSEFVGVPMNIHFEAAGRPVVFSFKNPSFEGNLVLATLNSGMESQTETTLVDRPVTSAKRNPNNRNTTQKVNKSKSKAEKKPTRARKTLERTMARNAQENRTIDASKNDLKQSNNADNSCVEEEIEIKADSSSKNIPEAAIGDDITARCNRLSVSGRNSSSLSTKKRKPRESGSNEARMLEDVVAKSPSPPSKKARLIFQKCFQRTFNPNTLPGYDIILVQDSDEGCSD